jgi:hypothetical protein
MNLVLQNITVGILYVIVIFLMLKAIHNTAFTSTQSHQPTTFGQLTFSNSFFGQWFEDFKKKFNYF